MTVRRLLACAIALLATTSAAAAPTPCTEPGVSEEIGKACRDYRLRSAEKELQEMHDRAAEVSRKPARLAADQAAWATQTLRRCPTDDCMSTAYAQRTTALRLAHFDALRINDKPLTAQDTTQICRSVATLASEKRLARLRLPSAGSWRAPDGPSNGWSLTAEEKQTLAQGERWLYGEPIELYRIKLTASGKAARYGAFAAGGTCAIDPVANVDRVLAGLLGGKDVEEEINGDEGRRWENFGGGDYPIVLNGRNLLITASLGDDNLPSTVSWLKPDGRIETVCTMSANAVYSKVVESHDDAVCQGVASGRIPALPTWRVDANLALDRSQPDSRAQYETRYGGYADEVVLLPHNPSGNGSGEQWAVFTYHSGAGCGARWQWLRLLTPDFGAATSHALNAANYRDWETVNVYEYGQARYVERLDRQGNGELLRAAKNGDVEQVCRFESHHEFRDGQDRPRPVGVEPPVETMSSRVQRSEAMIAKLYAQVLARVDAAQQKPAIAEHQNWFAQRNRTCKPPTAWIRPDRLAIPDIPPPWSTDNLLLTLCLENGADTRIQALEKQLDADIAQAVTAPLGLSDMRSKKAHHSGRHYVEIVFEPSALPATFDTTLSVSLGNSGFQGVLEQMLRPTPPTTTRPRQQRVIGLAIDLDAGRLYPRLDDVWTHGEPASGRGIELQPINSASVSIGTRRTGVLGDALQSNAVRVNFGDRPFQLAPPAGYTGFDADAVQGGSGGRYSVESPGSSVAGRPLEHWLEQYWSWLGHFQPGSTPSDDPTGKRCQQQSGDDVFFLTGSKATAPVVRSCTIARNQYLLLPLINVLAQYASPVDLDCTPLREPVEKINRSAEDLHLEINGQAIGEMMRHLAQTGCILLMNPAGTANTHAIGAGYWALLRFHDPGLYEVKVGGRYREDGFSQDITYRLTVQ